MPGATNRLAEETSPYLLQHARDPVDWYPWGPDALARARDEDKPIFLSIGYSACHWCHVMARESFADERIARLLNEHFVAIKVDREERPDVDEIYMRAVQSLTGTGGWPMSVFLTPEREPFYAGTYFPPYGALGRPGFFDLLRSLADAWRRGPERLAERARAVARRMAEEAAVDTRGRIAPDALDRSLAALQQSYDPRWGGFGDAPKFPHATDVRLLLRHGLRTGRREVSELALHTLEGMARGGVRDQLGGGFHRYSTDERWQVPHFEKMLYDNALLVPAYLEGHLVAPQRGFDGVARDVCEWALREMRTPEGAFASSQDADSEGEEGRFFTWTPDELAQVLGRERGARAQEWFDVDDDGSVEGGRSVLWHPRSDEEVAARLGIGRDELEAFAREARTELLRARENRPRPATDDKVLAGWNALMVSALAASYQVLGDARHLEAARRAATWVLVEMRRPDGALFATARGGRPRHAALLDDHAYLVQATLDLYESDFDPRWLAHAVELAERVEARFADRERGGYYTTDYTHETLITRLRTVHDGALPSANGVHASNLLRLAELTGERRFAERAERTVTGFGALVDRYPGAVGQLLIAVDFLAAGPREIVVAGEPGTPQVEALLAVVRRRFLPQRVVALAHRATDAERLPILAGKDAPPGTARAYVCRGYVCNAPVETPEDLERALGG